MGSPNGTLISNMLGLPTVTGVQPSNGPVVGGTQVAISGMLLAGVTQVLFGGNPGKFNPADPNNTDTQISAVSPLVNMPGLVDVQVTTAAGTSAANPSLDQFEYVFPVPNVLKVDPPSGSISGVYPLTISGTGFTGATSVDFEGAVATSTVPLDGSDPGSHVVSDTVINVTAPDYITPDTVHVSVTNPTCTSAATSADIFVYT